ncbi:hypothetical protein RPMA_18580 [Tardiphaga alba]|uniref:Uncharacterized protein n=1 Tax=Tardiphaga alba TaxID=340268 RepID=A0ABX8ACB8_9BRAD|nr:hypothetical protein [Tardiphaga alba]QUS40616.1 hypothetical protein RPMA_18580 [Tardiphaga alba]
MKILSAAIILSTLVATPALAKHWKHHRHGETFVFAAPGQPYKIRFDHNYGPGLTAGTFAYYDGPLSRRCKQSAAAYRGQDGRAHPCF